MSVCEETDAVAMVCSDGSLWIIAHIAHLMSAPETLRRVEGVPLLTASVSLLAWAGGKLLVPHGGESIATTILFPINILFYIRHKYAAHYKQSRTLFSLSPFHQSLMF